MTIGPDIIPVIASAVGVGIGLAWALISGNRAYAREALEKQLLAMQQMLEFKDADRERIRSTKVKLEEDNERLNVRLARLEAERGPAGPA